MVAAGFPPDDAAYNQAICAHAKARDLDRAAALYASATAAGARLGDVTFSTLLSALEKCVPYYDGHDPLPAPPPPGTRPPWMTDEGAAAVDRVRALWADMGHQGVRPSTFTHRAIAACLARAGDLAGAWAAAQEQAASQSSGLSLIPAVIGTHLTLGCLWLGDWDGARRGLADLAACDPATAVGGVDPGRLVSDALRAGTADGFAFALDAAKALRPLFWAPGAPGLGARAGGEDAKQPPAPSNGDAKAPASSAPSASRPNLRRLLCAAHELGWPDDARLIASWAVEDGWRDPASVGLVARTLAASGDVGGAIAYLRPFVEEGRETRFEPALAALVAVGDASDEAGRGKALEAALRGPLAPFMPPPGWHHGLAAAAAAAAAGQAGTSMPPPPMPGVTVPTPSRAPGSFGSGRRLSGGHGGGSGSGSDRDTPGPAGGGGGRGRRTPGPWG